MPEQTMAPEPFKLNGKTRAEYLGTTFQAAVKGQIGNNKDHGWGMEDSFTAIDAVVAADVEFAIAAKEDMAKYSLSIEAGELIKGVVNPSQFRQKLESAKVLNESKKGSKAQAKIVNSLVAGL